MPSAKTKTWGRHKTEAEESIIVTIVQEPEPEPELFITADYVILLCAHNSKQWFYTMIKNMKLFVCKQF